MERVTPALFARLIGVAEPELPAFVREALLSSPLRYRRLAPAERDAVLRDLREQIDSPSIAEVGPHRQEVWERGWGEALAGFVGSGHDAAHLVPRYTRRGEAIRFDGDYAQPDGEDFEVRLSRHQRQTLFGRFFAGCARVYEFGCGTGLNLVYLSEVLPGTPLVGLDWVDASRRLVEAIAARLPQVSYRPFDFFRVAPFELGEGSGVCTVTALEQAGADFGPFLDFLLAARPRVALHIEPLAEFYGADPFGVIGSAYHRKRRYLDGFLTRLERLAAQGRVEILFRHPTGFGIQRHDPFSAVAWRPLT